MYMNNDMYGFVFSYKFKNECNLKGYDTHYSLIVTPKIGSKYLKTCHGIKSSHSDHDFGYTYTRPNAGEGGSFLSIHAIISDLLGIEYEYELNGLYRIDNIISSLTRYKYKLSVGWENTYDNKLVGCFHYCEDNMKIYICKNRIDATNFLILKLMSIPGYYLKIFSEIYNNSICLKNEEFKTILKNIQNCDSFIELKMKQALKGEDNLENMRYILGVFQQCGTHSGDAFIQKCERFHSESQK